MKKNIFILLLMLVVLLAGFGVWYLLMSRAPVPSTVVTPGGFPSGTSSEPTPGGDTPTNNGSNGKKVVATVRGDEIEVRDFTQQPGTSADASNPGAYYLAGEFTPTNPAPRYTIRYTERDRSFTISLWEEPLGEMRRAAEQELLSKLGISETQACELLYNVLVPYDVNPILSSKNLGFSFCPGSVPL